MYLCVKVVVFALFLQFVYKTSELFQQCGNFRFSLFLIVNAMLQISIICLKMDLYNVS